MPSHLELISTISTEEIVSTISELAHEPFKVCIYTPGSDSADLIDSDARWYIAYHVAPGGVVLVRMVLLAGARE
jgi:hypothetical protein